MGISFEDSFAQTAINISDEDFIIDANNLVLDGARKTVSFTIGSSTYVAVTAYNDDGVQILDVSDPGNITAIASITDGPDFPVLDGPIGITSFKIGSVTYLAVAASQDDGVQILDVSNLPAITAVASITDSTDFPELDGARNVITFKIGSATYLAVTAYNDDGVQILDVSNLPTITAVASITDSTDFPVLDGARGITSFKVGNVTYLAVTAGLDDGVQILDVSNLPTITATTSITDSTDFPTLDSPNGITSFKIGNSMYVVVASYNDDGVQILDVSNLPTITAVASITDSTDFPVLDGARGIISLKIGNVTYLVITASADDGVQILDVSNLSSITSVDSIINSSSTRLDSPNGITLFRIGSSTYAAVAAFNDDSLQTFLINQTPNANAGRDITGYFGRTITLDGSSSTDPDGDTLQYSWQQNPTDTVTLENENKVRATFTAPDEPVILEFTLTVSDDSLQDIDTITVTITKPVARNIKDMEDTLASAQITGPNQITMAYYEELFTFINSYLNFTITGEDTPRNITGIDGSPSKSATVNIDGEDTDVFVTTLTFDGEPAPLGSTGSMYMQHADHYLAFLQIQDGQN